MKNRECILDEFNNVPSGTLIMTGKLYRDKYSSVMSEVAFAQAVSRLCRSGKITRISKGIYCYPKKTSFGTVLPSDRDIVRIFTMDSYGVVVGYDLYNELGITTQVSKKKLVYSSMSEEQLKQIGNVVVHKYDLEYTPEIKTIIKMMEVLHHYRDIQDINGSMMIHALERLVSEYSDEAFDVVQKEIGYPKWVIAFLREVLNYYHIPNNLNRYL